eukprot:544435-Amphidinium_carterae.1
MIWGLGASCGVQLSQASKAYSATLKRNTRVNVGSILFENWEDTGHSIEPKLSRCSQSKQHIELPKERKCPFENVAAFGNAPAGILRDFHYRKGKVHGVELEPGFSKRTCDGSDDQKTWHVLGFCLRSTADT